MEQPNEPLKEEIKVDVIKDEIQEEDNKKIKEEDSKEKIELKDNSLSKYKFIGLTKWFNEKSGFGFISYPYGLCGIENGTKDIFVHYSNINPVNKEAYKALHTGEYVEFNIANISEMNDNKDIRTQAVNVTGVGGGMLMNEYRTYISKINGENLKKNNVLGMGGFNSGNGCGFQGKGGFGKGGIGKGGMGKGGMGKGSKGGFRMDNFNGNKNSNFENKNMNFTGKIENKNSQKEEWTPK